MARRAVPRGAGPQKRRLAREPGSLVRRRRSTGARVRAVGTAGPDPAAVANVPDAYRGAGTDVRAAVRYGTRHRRVRRDARRSGPVEPDVGATGPARAVVPLSPPVPRRTPGRAGTRSTRPDPGLATSRRHLVPGQRPAGGGTGVLDGRRGRRWDGAPGGAAILADLPARPADDPVAVARMAGRAGRDHATPDGCGLGLAGRRDNRPAHRGRAVGRRGRSLAAGCGAAR